MRDRTDRCLPNKKDCKAYLTLRAYPKLILGVGSHLPPTYLDCEWIHSFQEYKATVSTQLKSQPYEAGIFSAAVADYQPESVFDGKLPSGTTDLKLLLIPTEKVIQLVRKQFPQLMMVTFKYEEKCSHEQLMQIARQRLETGYNLVVANRGEEKGPQGEQIAWMVSKQAPIESALGKPAIAKAILKRIVDSLPSGTAS